MLTSDEKIGAASAFEVLPLDAVTAVVVDATADAAALQQLREAGTALIESA